MAVNALSIAYGRNIAWSGRPGPERRAWRHPTASGRWGFSTIHDTRSGKRTQRCHDQACSCAEQCSALLRWTPDSRATGGVKGRPKAERGAETGEGGQLVEATAKVVIAVPAPHGDP